MTAQDFDQYFQQGKERYINDLSQNPEIFEKLTGMKPRNFAEKQFAEMLPDGVNTANNLFFNIYDEIINTKVGIAWFIYHPNHEMSFIGDIFIDKPFRGKGYGTAVLYKLEDIATNQHHTNKIGLNVFKHNPRAHKLYLKLGYQDVRKSPINWDMIKNLPPDSEK